MYLVGKNSENITPTIERAFREGSEKGGGEIIILWGSFLISDAMKLIDINIPFDPKYSSKFNCSHEKFIMLGTIKKA